MLERQAQLAAMHGAGLTDAEVQRIKRGMQDDVVRVQVGRSVQSVYMDERFESTTAHAEEHTAESTCTGSEEGICTAELSDEAGALDAGADSGAEGVAEVIDADYYDAYMNTTAEGGAEYYDDYFLPANA